MHKYRLYATYEAQREEGKRDKTREKRKKERGSARPNACLMVIFLGVSRALQYYLSALNRMSNIAFHGAQFFISLLLILLLSMLDKITK